MRPASAATIRSKSERTRTASSGNSFSRGCCSVVRSDSFGFTGGLNFDTGEHDGGADNQQPHDRALTGVRSKGEAQSAGDARGGYRMLADAAAGTNFRDLHFNAIVDFVQRFAQVFLGLVQLIFYVLIFCHLSKPAMVSVDLPAHPQAPSG